MHTVDDYFFFLKSSALPSLTENVDLFVNHRVFLDYRWICFIVAHSEKKILTLFRSPKVKMILCWLTGCLKMPEGPLSSNSRVF